MTHPPAPGPSSARPAAGRCSTARPGGPSRRPRTPPRPSPARTSRPASRTRSTARSPHQLRRRGWTVRIEPYAGYGATGWVRVLARTLLAAPQVRDDDLPGAGGTRAGGRAIGDRAARLAQLRDGPGVGRGARGPGRRPDAPVVDRPRRVRRRDPRVRPGTRVARRAAHDERRRHRDRAGARDRAGRAVRDRQRHRRHRDGDPPAPARSSPRGTCSCGTRTHARPCPGMARLYAELPHGRPGRAGGLPVDGRLERRADDRAGSCAGTATRPGRSCSRTGVRPTAAGSAAVRPTR